MKIDSNAPITTIPTLGGDDNPRRGRRAAGEPPQEEKKPENSDPDQASLGGRRLGGGRGPAKDPFAFVDEYKPSVAVSKPKEEDPYAALGDTDSQQKNDVGGPLGGGKKPTYEQRMAAERAQGVSLLDMIGGGAQAKPAQPVRPAGLPVPAKKPAHLKPAYGDATDSDDLDGYSMPSSSHHGASDSNKNKVGSSHHVGGSALAGINSGAPSKPNISKPLVPSLDELEDLEGF